jgi:hypothetical protein
MYKINKFELNLKLEIIFPDWCGRSTTITIQSNKFFYNLSKTKDKSNSVDKI